MRIVAALLIMLVAGCANQNESMDRAELLDFAERYAAAWSGQDAAVWATFYTETGSLRVNDGEPAVGREELAALAQSYMTALPDMVVRFDSLGGSDSRPQFHWTLIATNSGPGGNGNSIHISGYEEWTMSEDGLIEQSLGHIDTAEYERQLAIGTNRQ